MKTALSKKADQTSLVNIQNLITKKVDQAAFAKLQNMTACINTNSTNKEIIFSGCNLHVENGAGSTAHANGYGNLILGYNEPEATYPREESYQLEKKVINPKTDRIGSHNIVIGPGHSYTAHSGIVAGLGNSILNEYASVTGGYSSKAEGFGASISGGYNHWATGNGSSVTGGKTNGAHGKGSCVSGGFFNAANSAFSSVSGGFNNGANGEFSSVSGGHENVASGAYSSILGGEYNKVNGLYSVYIGDGVGESCDGNSDCSPLCTGDHTICPLNSGTSNILVISEWELGFFDASVGAENPLRGFASWSEPNTLGFPSSLEYHPMNLSQVMTGNNTFNWTDIETLLNATSSRGHHTILRFVLDTPGEGSGVPSFLNSGKNRVTYQQYSSYGGGKSPNYSNKRLLTALQQFIAEFGRLYDGDPRIGFIQVGLLGFWGEWHTYRANGVDSSNDWIPATTKDSVASWFDAAFNKTQIQLRVPSWGTKQIISNFGFYDDSFANMTLGGTAAGGFFWPKIIEAQDTEFWKSVTMGGELFPYYQSKIFDPISAEPHEDFSLCVNTTHATYLVNAFAFASDGGYTGDSLANAKAAANSLGYAFQVTNILAELKDDTHFGKLTVNVTQRGVAPFYYPLCLVVVCDNDTNKKYIYEGLEKELITKGDVAEAQFDNLNCEEVLITLFSNHTLKNQEIKFAQRDGTVVARVLN